ncbi:FadR/GntR family transcriptional regulator [Chthonobacter albigriseus]|uniref:FadR/GntR family transcriptional regulator n=1 Tax=Chthonobacter albigriseus TaxID=1683161 RepID=UPI001FCE71FA|nr:FadR/GntR family transcriptional regulator [Chthonobacter albigriseus]
MTSRRTLSVLKQMPELRDGVSRQTVRDIVADKIASLIASGILQVGDALPSERDLAAAFQVSRETVRGGIQILAARGVIEVWQGARTRVVSADVAPLASGLREPRLINSYDLDSIHAARLLVERQVVADAAERMDAATLAKLDASLAEQRAALDEPVRFLICDREFHLSIYKSCGNPVLGDFVSDLYSYMMEHRRVAVSKPGSIQKSFDDHVLIVEGLRARDPAAVVAAFDIHLDRIYTTTRSLLVADDRVSQHEAAG